MTGNLYLKGISFVWPLVALAVLALLLGARAFFSYRRMKTEAGDNWDYMVANNMQELRVNKEAYIQTYCRVNAPRATLYLALGAGLILVLTPVALSLINFSLWALWEFNGQSRVFEPGYMVWEFSIFFLMIAIWAGIGAFVARRYHARTPGLMRDELIQARMDFEPAERLVVGANPVHIQAFEDEEEGVGRQVYRGIFEGALELTHSEDKNWNETTHICDTYTDGSGMNICVHSSGNAQITDKTHPFFFIKQHAREDAIDLEYSIIMKIKGAHAAYEKMMTLGLPVDKMTGHKHSTLRSFRHESLTFYLYEG